jgi:hypothetical protein
MKDKRPVTILLRWTAFEVYMRRINSVPFVTFRCNGGKCMSLLLIRDLNLTK